jgi:hydroxymethylpyrimidine/phosphomethylpyrimidine kinase
MGLGNVEGGEQSETKVVPVALTVAGSDSGGGAGIQADLKTFAALKVHGTSVVTLVTAQNTVGVTAIGMISEALVQAQLDAVCTDLRPAAAKTGALGSEAMIELVAAYFTQRPIGALVVDPVMVSKHGDSLLPEQAVASLKRALLPLATVITPNRYEAELLCGRSVSGMESMKDAARQLFDYGARNVLIKGAHLDRVARDLLYDGTGFLEFGADRVASERVHGSGCVFSAAICAYLTRGEELPEAVNSAREFITGAIAKAPKLGHGISPVHPLHALWG